jgi:hypothetical protein
VKLARRLSLLKPVTAILIATFVVDSAAGAALSAAPTASLSVTTNPAGAAVYVDGQFAGRTPMAVANVASGDHRVRVVKDGYLENARLIRVPGGKAHALEITLTPATGTGNDASMQLKPPPPPGSKKWLWIGIAAAGGGTAAALALTGGNKAPIPGTVQASPATGLQSSTGVVLTSVGASDPEGKTLSYQWDLGDGGSATGQTTTRVYSTSGTFAPTVTVSDGKKSATTPAGSVTIRSMTGIWTSTLFGGTTFTITQSGSSIGGSYRDSFGPGTISGTVQANNSVSITVTQTGFTPFTFLGPVSETINTWSGNISGLTGPQTFTLTRQ